MPYVGYNDEGFPTPWLSSQGDVHTIGTDVVHS